MSKFSFNGAEFDLNLLDADVMDRYEKGMQRMQDRSNEAKASTGVSAADGLRLQCRIVNELFDYLLGDGASEMLFNGSVDVELHLRAVGTLVEFANETSDRMQDIVDEYSPARVRQRYNNNSMQGHKKKNGKRRYN